MKLELAQVRHVAKLARLSLTAEEETRFQQQLSAVLDAVESLSQVDTTGVPPTTFAIATTAPTRPDEVQGELPLAQSLANAPQKEGTSFAIPRVID
jgi:aspartyl-tRNA(Asn)/glutamyl-tRNA(Gln) amidotransferase subunit C